MMMMMALKDSRLRLRGRSRKPSPLHTQTPLQRITPPSPQSREIGFDGGGERCGSQVAIVWRRGARADSIESSMDRSGPTCLPTPPAPSIGHAKEPPGPPAKGKKYDSRHPRERTETTAECLTGPAGSWICIEALPATTLFVGDTGHDADCYSGAPRLIRALLAQSVVSGDDGTCPCVGNSVTRRCLAVRVWDDSLRPKTVLSQSGKATKARKCPGWSNCTLARVSGMS